MTLAMISLLLIIRCFCVDFSEKSVKYVLLSLTSQCKVFNYNIDNKIKTHVFAYLYRNTNAKILSIQT